jgi:hypothetical protein
MIDKYSIQSVGDDFIVLLICDKTKTILLFQQPPPQVKLNYYQFASFSHFIRRSSESGFVLFKKKQPVC